MTAALVRDRMRKRRKYVVGTPSRSPLTAAAQEARAGRALLFDFSPALALGVWRDGGYPKKFFEHAYLTLRVTDPARVLHMCAGGVRSGVTTDIRIEVKPMVVADCRALPFRDGSFDWVMADPPYAESYAEQLYGTGSVYPRPGHILREAARVLRPGGRVGLLHYIVPRARHGLRRVGTWGVFVGPDMAIRAWSVYEKAQPRLLS